MPGTPRPTAAELELLTVLWSRGPSTVRNVQQALAGKPARYTSVLKILQIMAVKGLARRDEAGRAHLYEAARPREWTQRQLAGDLLQRAFGGSAVSLTFAVNGHFRPSSRRISFAFNVAMPKQAK